jgi:hypothetical protein
MIRLLVEFRGQYTEVKLFGKVEVKCLKKYRVMNAYPVLN